MTAEQSAALKRLANDAYEHLNPTSRAPRLIGVSQHWPLSSNYLTGHRIHSETR